MLQEQKLSLANGILTGTATKAVKTLTIDDLKMLFYPQPMKSVHSGAVSGYSGGAAAAPGWKLDID